VLAAAGGCRAAGQWLQAAARAKQQECAYALHLIHGCADRCANLSSTCLQVIQQHVPWPKCGCTHITDIQTVTACWAVHACGPPDNTKTFYTTCALLQQIAYTTVVDADIMPTHSIIACATTSSLLSVHYLQPCRLCHWTELGGRCQGALGPGLLSCGAA